MGALQRYMAQYDHEHSSAWNKLLHSIGIPVILGSFVVVFLSWPWALGMFIGGWVLLFLGHRIEGNNPAFFRGPIYFLVGPLWVAREIKELIAGHPKSASAKQP